MTHSAQLEQRTNSEDLQLPVVELPRAPCQPAVDTAQSSDESLISLIDRLLGEQQQLTAVEQFSEGVAFVDVVGTTKGRGFAGVMKRHGFGGQPDSHGTERKHRAPGSIGGHCNKLRGRGVKKGKPMAGHMGDVRRTARNLRLVGVDAEHDLLLIKGSVPGPNGGQVFVRRSKTKAGS